MRSSGLLSAISQQMPQQTDQYGSAARGRPSTLTYVAVLAALVVIAIVAYVLL